MILTWNLDQEKLDKKNKETSKKLGDDAMPANPWRPCLFSDLLFFQNLLHSSHTIALSKVAFLPKKLIFG